MGAAPEASLRAMTRSRSAPCRGANAPGTPSPTRGARKLPCGMASGRPRGASMASRGTVARAPGALTATARHIYVICLHRTTFGAVATQRRLRRRIDAATRQVSREGETRAPKALGACARVAVATGCGACQSAMMKHCLGATFAALRMPLQLCSFAHGLRLGPVTMVVDHVSQCIAPDGATALNVVPRSAGTLQRRGVCRLRVRCRQRAAAATFAPRGGPSSGSVSAGTLNWVSGAPRAGWRPALRGARSAGGKWSREFASRLQRLRVAPRRLRRVALRARRLAN